MAHATQPVTHPGAHRVPGCVGFRPSQPSGLDIVFSSPAAYGCIMHARSVSLSMVRDRSYVVKNRSTVPVLLIVVLGLMTAFAGSTMAQGGPSASPQAGASIAHPAHIFDGSCANVGDIVYPLNDLVLPPQGTPAPSDTTAATPGASLEEVVAYSSTTLEGTLDELLQGGYSLNVHESPEAIETHIACGDIVGPATDGAVTIDLPEVNGSGFDGIAVIRDQGDGTLSIEVFLSAVDGGSPGASPEAQP